MNLKKYYLFLLVICFTVGIYVWKVTRKTVKPLQSSFTGSSDGRPGILVYVGDDAITTEDLDFEYSLHTRGVFDAKDLTPVPNLGKRAESQLIPLKERLLTAMIERKLLFLYINQDRNFTIDDPSRFTSCLSDWQETIKAAEKGIFNNADGERLKERLCERSIIDQYLIEKIFPKVSTAEEEIKEYYQTNKKLFIKPKRVLIRQIVVKTEQEAEKARVGLNRSNFGERARQLSITPEAEEGGLVGPFAQGELPRFFDLAFSLARGEIYGIIKSTYGYHIIMVEEQYAKKEETLEQARKEIVKLLKKEKQHKEYKKWIEVAINAIPVKTPGSKF